MTKHIPYRRLILLAVMLIAVSSFFAPAPRPVLACNEIFKAGYGIVDSCTLEPRSSAVSFPKKEKVEATASSDGEGDAIDVGEGDAAAKKPVKCHPNYIGVCLDANSEDYDCDDGSGDGPDFIKGPFKVKGDDVFGLDRDKDGLGCEPNGG